MTSPLIISVLVFVGISLGVGVVITTIYVKLFRYRAELDRRFESSQAKHDRSQTQALFLERRGTDHGRSSLQDAAREYFEQAHFRIDFNGYLRRALAIATGLGLVVAAVLRCWWLAPVIAVVVLLAACGQVVMTRRTRRRQLIVQLPKALEVISRAVRAGQTVPASFQIVADDFDGPIADEFRLCYEQQNLGISYE